MQRNTDLLLLLARWGQMGESGLLQLPPVPSPLPMVLARKRLAQFPSPSFPGQAICLPRAAKRDELISRTQEVALTPSSQFLLKLSTWSQAGQHSGVRPTSHQANLLTHLPLQMRPASWSAGSSTEEFDGLGHLAGEVAATATCHLHPTFH